MFFKDRLKKLNSEIIENKNQIDDAKSPTTDDMQKTASFKQDMSQNAIRAKYSHDPYSYIQNRKAHSKLLSIIIHFR